MTLIICDECGKQISDKAASCVACGAPVVMPETVDRKQAKPSPKVDSKPAVKKVGKYSRAEQDAVYVNLANSRASLEEIATELNRNIPYVRGMSLRLLEEGRIDRLPPLTEADRAKRVEELGTRQRGQSERVRAGINPTLVCPHCQTKGKVSSTQGTSVATTSGGFFADLISGTKRTQTRSVTKFNCKNCGTSWEVA